MPSNGNRPHAANAVVQDPAPSILARHDDRSRHPERERETRGDRCQERRSQLPPEPASADQIDDGDAHDGGDDGTQDSIAWE